MFEFSDLEVISCSTQPYNLVYNKNSAARFNSSPFCKSVRCCCCFFVVVFCVCFLCFFFVCFFFFFFFWGGGVVVVAFLLLFCRESWLLYLEQAFK